MVRIRSKTRFLDIYKRSSLAESISIAVENPLQMDIVPQKQELEISNLDYLTVDNVAGKKSKHGPLLPHTVRCIISGPSNVGKTNVAFNLLTNDNGLHFNNVYIFSKSLNQPKYMLLERILATIPEISLYKFNANEEIMEPSQAKPYSVFLFDDVSCENHDMIRMYFAMGRHNHIDSIYIGQTYSKIPKQLIRDNVNLLVVFKQDETNLKHIYNEHVGVDMPYDKFKLVCKTAWNEPYSFLVINKDQELNNGRYRIKFDKYILIN